MWRTPVIQAVVFVPRLVYFIVGMLVILVAVTIYFQGRDLVRHLRRRT